MKAAATIAIALALAGCMEATPEATLDDAPASAEDAWGDVAAALDGLTCDDPDPVRALGTISLEEGMHGEADRHGDLIAVARYAAGGFELVDRTNALAPTLLGTHFGQGTGLDLKFSPDGTAVLLGSNAGIEIVDVRDPSEPQSVSNWTFPRPVGPAHPVQQVHMLYAVHIAQRDWVFMTPTNTDGLWILELTGDPGQQELELAAKTDLRTHGAIIGPHDMWITHDEKLDQWLLYSVDGFDGWSVWNVDDPTDPQLMTTVPPLEPFQGYTHTLQAAWIGDRRIVATVAEVGHNALKVYDATDLRAPILLGTWQAADDGDAGPTAPQHNIQLVQGYLFMAHYVQGAYIFDLNDLGASLPGILGLSPMAQFQGTRDAPVGSVWDVLVEDGVLWVAEHTTLYAVGFGCMLTGDATWSGTA